MGITTWLAYAAFGVTTLAMVFTVNSLYAMFQAGAAAPDRRRRLRRMGVAVGLWEISVGLCILAMPGGESSWASAIGPIGLGCMFLAGSWLARKLGIAPWWAPE